MGKVVLISGGSEGLGKAIAKELTVDNTVIIFSSNRAKIAATAKELGCEGIECDVTDYAAVKSLVEATIRRHGSLDCVINNAGIFIEGKLEDNDPALIHKMVEVNTLGTMYLTHAALPHMKRAGRGTIINVISQAGLHAKPEHTTYNASKWAITGFTKSLEMELQDSGIRVAGIYPGKMNTKIFEKQGIKKDLSDALEPAEVAKTIKFMLSFDETVNFPEVGIKHIKG